MLLHHPLGFDGTVSMNWLFKSTRSTLPSIEIRMVTESNLCSIPEEQFIAFSAQSKTPDYPRHEARLHGMVMESQCALV